MLTNEDIELLMKALDAYQQSELKDALMMNMFSLGMSTGDEREKAKSDFKQSMMDAQEKNKIVEETVILLKAKLIQMKNKNVANDAAEFLKKPDLQG